MTPKQKYDERKRLRVDREYREELRHKDRADREADMEARVIHLVASFERIADVLELWADQQKEPPHA